MAVTSPLSQRAVSSAPLQVVSFGKLECGRWLCKPSPAKVPVEVGGGVSASLKAYSPVPLGMSPRGPHSRPPLRGALGVRVCPHKTEQNVASSGIWTDRVIPT